MLYSLLDMQGKFFQFRKKYQFQEKFIEVQLYNPLSKIKQFTSVL